MFCVFAFIGFKNYRNWLFLEFNTFIFESSFTFPEITELAKLITKHLNGNETSIFGRCPIATRRQIGRLVNIKTD